jgi:hypothetical protein
VKQGASGASSYLSGPGGRPAEPCTTALQAGRNTTTLFMVRLCSLAEPTGPAQDCRAYLDMVRFGQGVFQHPASPHYVRRRREIAEMVVPPGNHPAAPRDSDLKSNKLLGSRAHQPLSIPSLSSNQDNEASMKYSGSACR